MAGFLNLMSDAEQLLESLRHEGWVRDPQATLTPLAGGVSSDIYLVQDGRDRFVVKRALAKLRVKDDWRANTGRNATEQNYLRCVARWLPASVPRLLSSNPQDGYFSMEFLGAGFVTWKKLLLEGRCEPAHAAQAGEILGIIHRRTAGDAALARDFETTADFHQLRLEPYLLTTGERHPPLRPQFEREAKRLEATREALVHGDFSPKNILIGGGRMVLLDCETAWYGDPAFDVAFLLNHLFLKSLHHAPKVLSLEKMIAAFWAAYAEAREDFPIASRLAPSDRSAEPAPDSNQKTKRVERVLGALTHRVSCGAQPVAARLVPLLLMLLLARVDGKSPVEYLTERKRQFIRDFVHTHLPSPPASLNKLSDLWFEQVYRCDPGAFPPEQAQEPGAGAPVADPTRFGEQPQPASSATSAPPPGA